MNEVDNFILQKDVENGKGPSIGKHRTKRENFLADPAAYQEQIDLQNQKTRHEFEMVLSDLTLRG